MVYFLTSSPTIGHDGGLNYENGFVDNLHEVFTYPLRGLFIAASPLEHEMNEHFGYSIYNAFSEAGLEFSEYEILDGENAFCAGELVSEAEFIVLAGGHVPTQNDFFKSVGLRELIKGYDGVVMGISAGTMNSADTVYAVPELPGEAVDTDYERFIEGLGITHTMVLPHYQETKDTFLDGMPLFEGIVYPDSSGRRFLALPDGSYILGEDGEEELHGEGWLIENGEISLIGGIGGTARL